MGAVPVKYNSGRVIVSPLYSTADSEPTQQMGPFLDLFFSFFPFFNKLAAKHSSYLLISF